jgi:RNAse (barnase) inhibitor barstar
VEQPNNYSVFTIDMKFIWDIKILFEEFSRSLGCPPIDESDLNNLDRALRASLEKPINLIIYNFRIFRKRFKQEARILGQIIFDYNQLEESRSIMFDEYDEISKAKKPLFADSIWERNPSCYGYRGDPHLWKDMMMYSKGREIPTDESMFISQVHKLFQEITGQPLFNNEPFYLCKYDSGAMFGGVIGCSYWIDYLIPLLIGRYRKLVEIGI